MKLSARTRYAARILLDLALNNENCPVPTAMISQHTGITVKFIEQILKPLKKNEIIDSVRGAAGGYCLKKDPKALSLGDIVRIMEGGINLTTCCTDHKTCDRSDTCRTRGAWKHVSNVLEKELDSIMLADLMESPDGECKTTVPHLCKDQEASN